MHDELTKSSDQLEADEITVATDASYTTRWDSTAALGEEVLWNPQLGTERKQLTKGLAR
jgi:hypothetical protein